MSNLVVTNVNGLDAQAGKANAWADVSYAGSPSTAAGLNISSYTDVGVGSLEINYTNNFASADYAALMTSEFTVGADGGPNWAIDNTVKTASATRVYSFAFSSGANYDVDALGYVVFGDLA